MASGASWNFGTVNRVGVKASSAKTSASHLRTNHIQLSSWYHNPIKPPPGLGTEALFLEQFEKLNIVGNWSDLRKALYTVQNTWLARIGLFRKPAAVDRRFKKGETEANGLPECRWFSIEDLLFVQTMDIYEKAQVMTSEIDPVGGIFFEWSEARRSIPQEYPAPDLSWPLSDTSPLSYLKTGSTSLQALLTSLMRLSYPRDFATNPEDKLSELVIERGIGSCIELAFCGNKIGVASSVAILNNNEELKALTLSQSFPRPDFFSFHITPMFSGLPFVISAGEGKKQRNHTTARFQLMAALHPTLNAMVVWYLQAADVLKANSSNTVNLDDPDTWTKVFATPFPSWFYVYGIYYSRDEIIFYTHFPVIRTELIRGSNAAKRIWTLLQVELARYDLTDIDPVKETRDEARALRTRFLLGISLMVVRRHNEEFEKMFGSFANKFSFKN